jgi:hypothetical protein
MRAREAYDEAVQALVGAVTANDVRELPWLAEAVRALWDRTKQEAVAEQMDCCHPGEAVRLINGEPFTRNSLQAMKDQPEMYGSIYRSDVRAGLST